MRLLLKIIVALVFLVLLGAWYLGVFSSVTVEDRKEGGYTIVGLEFTGPYSKTGKYMKEVDEKLKSAGLTPLRGFGIYYDDPKTTPPEKCRSFVGSILEAGDLEKIPNLRSEKFKVDTIPVSNALVTTFPVKASLSYMVGPMRAYPALSQYMTKNKYILSRSLEVYDRPAKQIRYVMQYETQEKTDDPIVADPTEH